MLTRKEEEIGVNRVAVRLMGDEYVIRGRDSAEHLAEVAAEVEARLQSEASGNPKLAKTQLAMLVALKITDELHKMRREHEEVVRLLQEAK